MVDNTDNFVFKLNAAGSALAYSTYLGGTDNDSARGIAVDAAGQRVRDGRDAVGRLPDHGGRRSAEPCGGDYDMFVTKLNPTGSALVYSTFLGGTAVDNGERVAVDAAATPTCSASPARPTSRRHRERSTRRPTAASTRR